MGIFLGFYGVMLGFIGIVPPNAGELSAKGGFRGFVWVVGFKRFTGWAFGIQAFQGLRV